MNNCLIFDNKIDNEELKISIISPFARNEVEKHSFGGTSLIWMQKRYFDIMNYDTDVIYLSELKSPTSYLLDIASKIRQNPKNKIKANVSRRWLSNMLFWIFIDIFSRFDVLFKKRLTGTLRNSGTNILLCNYPTFYHTLFSMCRNRKIKCILFEHNVEYYFFKQMLNDKIIAYPFIEIWKMIERSAIRKSDIVLVVAPKDRYTLLKDMGIQYSSKIDYWIPFNHDREKFSKIEIYNIQKNASIEDRQFIDNIRNKTIIGFVGAHFEPNIIAVENIINIAKNINNEKITFLILGNVCEAFNDRKDIPNNVIMKGFVKDLNIYLSICNAFINPKINSDTGIEIKMFDYLKFGKPVISTKIGAEGFENFENVILLDFIEIPKYLDVLM